MDYDFDQLIWDTTNEAILLKLHATRRELSRLDFEMCDGLNAFRCIYGQLTGYCFSERALKLIQKCATVFFCSFDLNFDNIDKASIKKSLHCSGEIRYYSAIEMYAAHPLANMPALVAFLKNQTQTLDI